MHSNGAEFDVTSSNTIQDKVVSIVRSYPLLEIIQKNISKQLSSKIEPDDVLQDLLLSIVRTVDPETIFRMHDAGHLLAWLHTSARYTVSQSLRRMKTRKRHDGHDTFGETENAARSGPLLDAVDGARSPSSVEAATEAKDALLTALMTLEPKQKRALTLRYLEGYLPEEVAKIMHQPKNVVRGLLWHGAQKLRDKMGPAGQWFNDAEPEEFLWQVLGKSGNPTDNGKK
ncbi:MAG: sigma-70 family RNA polymerase sigma factor [Planctomycetes bacterium]|nr:sigma-70 family RNA polymerase sigma factor [Planctomycetota bacterium]